MFLANGYGSLIGMIFVLLLNSIKENRKEELGKDIECYNFFKIYV